MQGLVSAAQSSTKATEHRTLARGFFRGDVRPVLTIGIAITNSRPPEMAVDALKSRF